MDLLNAAMLGTARATVPSPPAELSAAHTDAPERALLRQAFAATLQERAAAVLPAGQPPGLAPPETRPVCHPRHVPLVQQMVTGPYEDALPEWLRLLAQAGQVISPMMVCDLLDTASGNPELAALAIPVLSERARWMARNYDTTGNWAWATVSGDDETTWQTGTGPARKAVLRSLRATDPARARELMTSTWAEDSAKDRDAFLEAFEVGLGPDDEPFLEQALTDRSKLVRITANGLLRKLPGSAFAQRQYDRLLPLITPHRKRLTVAALDDTVMDAMAQDGFDLTPLHDMGKSTWALQQLVAATPLCIWEQVTGQPPRKLIGFKVDDGMRDALQLGWADAASSQRDVGWAQALLSSARDNSARDNSDYRVVALAQTLPHDKLEEYVASQLDGKTHYYSATQLVTEPWSKQFTEQVWKVISRKDGYYGPAFTNLGTHGHLDCVPYLKRDLDRLSPQGTKAGQARDALALLMFRQQMTTTFTETR